MAISCLAPRANNGRWMVEAGMAPRTDAAGNLIGRYEGHGQSAPLIIASHLDSVRDGGFYDGPLGIMLGWNAWRRCGRRTAHALPIEIIAFGDEEGSRFPAAMLTSKAVAGAGRSAGYGRRARA
jgi:allantoate deiminase